MLQFTFEKNNLLCKKREKNNLSQGKNPFLPLVRTILFDHKYVFCYQRFPVSLFLVLVLKTQTAEQSSPNFYLAMFIFIFIWMVMVQCCVI